MYYLRRHSRRQHERVSQQEESQQEATDAEAANPNTAPSNQQQQPHAPIQPSDLQSALAAAGIETNNTESSGLVAPSSSSSEDDTTPEVANTTTTTSPNSGSDPSAPSVTVNPTSPSSSSSSTSPASVSPSYHSTPMTTTTAAVEHYNTTHPSLMMHNSSSSSSSSSATCTLLLFFFLLRLWIEAIIEQDIGLTFISLMATTWCYRWYVLRREAEREWANTTTTDHELSLESSNSNQRRRQSGADAAIDFDPDLGLMSFQAQLAMAILESQRQMIENGGYGGNDRVSENDNGPGVTDEAKQQTWTNYEWGKCLETTEKLRMVICREDSRGSRLGEYGSVSVVEDENVGGDVPSSSSSQQQQQQQQQQQLNTEGNEDEASCSKLEEGGLLVKTLDEEEPSCSICLCEYEHAETVTKLPCNHIFHQSCINSWTERHVRCPLCNYDLMTGFEQPESVRNQQQNSGNNEGNEAEQIAFRNMALSALGGRRIRARASRRGGRRSSRYVTLGAAEDSIV